MVPTRLLRIDNMYHAVRHGTHAYCGRHKRRHGAHRAYCLRRRPASLGGRGVPQLYSAAYQRTCVPGTELRGSLATISHCFVRILISVPLSRTHAIILTCDHSLMARTHPINCIHACCCFPRVSRCFQHLHSQIGLAWRWSQSRAITRQCPMSPSSVKSLHFDRVSSF